jgi:protein-S-isoprenylcysteine O-methyltransferase Ste14
MQESSVMDSTAPPAHPFFRKLDALIRYLSEDFLGGPRVLKFAWVINFQKAGTAFFVGFLMWYFQNTSALAWVYLALHGSYGFCWLLKDVTFPDPNWQKRVTFGGALAAFVLVLGPYWIFPFLLISGIAEGAALPWVAFAVALHTLGVAIMLVADAQKFYTLRVQRGLITSGLHKHVRHPNYLGEMMIYASYAIVVWHWLPWVILAAIWGLLFHTNMRMKEASMSRYPEWADYKARTGMVLPKLL